MDKLGRNYSLSIGLSNGGTVDITLPFTIEFDITRNTLSSANVCQIRIYNLSEVTRNFIRRNVSNYGLPFQPITLMAGYGSNNGSFGFNNLPVIFSGNISEAWSVREGVNMITQIECYDGGFAFANANVNPLLSNSLPSNIPTSTAIQTLGSSLSSVTIGGIPYATGLKLGAIGSFPTLIPNPAFSGNTCNVLKSLTGGAFFIDNGKINALSNTEYILNATGPLSIDASAGLLNTPVLEGTIVKFDMIFEPTLTPGSQVLITSETSSNFNGFCRINAVKHRGMISETVCGSVITTGEFFYQQILTPVVSLAL